MSSVLDRPRVRDRISDDDWEAGAISTAATQRMTLVGWPTRVRRFSFPFLRGQLVIECERSLPDWFQRTIASLDELGDLSSNWDSYGGKKIRHSSILAAIELLLSVIDDGTPAPAVVPANRGTVMFEWHARGVDLEIEVFGPGHIHVAFEDARVGTEWEAEIGSDLSPLVACIQRLSERD